MSKRKASAIAKRPIDNNTSLSESDSELELNPKRLRKQSSSSLSCSPPNEEFLSSFIESTQILTSSEDESSLEVSQSAQNDSNYENFSSFLKSFNLDSDSEKETDEQLTSSLQTSTPNNIRHSRKYCEQRRAYESCKSLMETSELGTRIIIVPSKNIEIVSLQHPSSVTLHGYLKVSVLFGRISIFGHSVNEGKNAKVFSTETTLLLKASTVKSTHLSNIQSVYKKLNKLVPKERSDDLDNFLEHVGPTTVVIVLEKCVLPPPLQFLELYFPNAVQTKRGRTFIPKYENERLCSVQELNAFTISSHNELISEEIKKAFQKSISGANFGPRIVVYGTKQSGKSSLLRYLINRTLNEFPAVYYLDIDPGQTEFTPGGVVSLTKVTEPLLGPPYSHQRKPLKMIFTGSITAETSPPMYIKSVNSLIETFTSRFPKEILFVNTMGWIKGIGSVCFQNVMKTLQPTMLIEFVARDQLPEMRREVLANGTMNFQIPIREPSGIDPFEAVVLRNFALLSYIGKCQKYYMEPTYLHLFRPVVVCWDKLAVYVMGKNVPSNRLIEAIHCSVVGLCHVNRSLMLESDKPEFPRTLFDEPINECMGFGVVRATDEINHLLYIVTPLTVEELKPVNAIIKGNVLLPSVVYLKQDMINLALPYTDLSKGIHATARKPVRKRARKGVI